MTAENLKKRGSGRRLESWKRERERSREYRGRLRKRELTAKQREAEKSKSGVRAVLLAVIIVAVQLCRTNRSQSYPFCRSSAFRYVGVAYSP